jgi:nucleotide-binding universal stress UspA family protein
LFSVTNWSKDQGLDFGKGRITTAYIFLFELNYIMKKILVPYDFSEQATNALRFALDMEKESQCELHLLHVVPMPILQNTTLMPIASVEEDILHDARKQAELRFEKIEKQYFRDALIKTKVRFGPTTDTILEYLSDHRIDLVVMGTKGASGMRELLVGSNTEKVVRSSAVPVLAVKQFIPYQRIRNIVFPNTLDEDSHEDLIAQVKTLQHSFDATLHIVWINTPLNFQKDVDTRERLKYFTSRYMLKDYTINIFNDMDEEAGIVNFTHTIDADMIALGTHGRKGLAHVISGSIAEDLVNHIDTPVWTFAIK